MKIPEVELGKGSSIKVEFKTEKIKKKKIIWSNKIIKCLFVLIFPSIFLTFALLVIIALIVPPNSKYEAPEIQKLRKVNNVILHDTLSLNKNMPLYQLQNKIHEDLLKDNEKINFNIANQELLSLDLITSEFSGSKFINIGEKSSIDITTNDKNSIINYNQFSEKGKEIILKQLEKNNVTKISMKITTKQNTDGTYSIMTMINK